MKFRVFYCKNSHQAILRWSSDDWKTYDQDKTKSLTIQVPTYAELLEENGKQYMYVSGECQFVHYENGITLK